MGINELVVVGAVSAAVLASGAGVAAAEASTRSDVCGAGRVCIYKYPDFRVKIGERAAGGGVVDIPPALGRQVSSWRNQTRVNAALYEGPGGRGRCITLRALGSDADLQGSEVTSWRTDRGC
ncbi:hypothetical protein FHS29_005231 [Saccharothrix tamanrassetensis]|uniref:Peptidase inhibitor family I36 n=1 Tax=Saccharothrix tamanrassetensis TaxID=1051531 RepID=A0A841CNY4_9PSEU|nr:peptidase inhibitor family I36 protein [Saccharothrix tamanrassetensis]MBB5958623.1 hypothetical protein [Saccharothrix tamanrassetensis]